MKLEHLSELPKLGCVLPPPGGTEVTTAFTSDLLSDVMANAKEGSVLITIQAHKNTVAVSSLVGVVAILVCNNRPVLDDMLVAAQNEGIAIFRTSKNQFETSHLIAQLLAH